MTPSLDLSDLIIPLIFIGVAIYQVLAKARRKPGEEEQEGSPFPGDFDPGPAEHPSDAQTWDELMEALGQKPEKPSESQPPPLVPATPDSLPPPLPRRIEIPQVTPSSVDPSPSSLTSAPSRAASRPEGSFWEGSADPSPWSQSPYRGGDVLIRTFGKPVARFRDIPAPNAASLRQILNQPNRIREAILINELLQKPVALRGSTMGSSG